jgi:hypothetical protein
MFSTLILSVEFRMLLLPRKVFSHRHLLSSTGPKMFAKPPHDFASSRSQPHLYFLCLLQGGFIPVHSLLWWAS